MNVGNIFIFFFLQKKTLKADKRNKKKINIKKHKETRKKTDKQLKQKLNKHTHTKISKPLRYPWKIFGGRERGAIKLFNYCIKWTKLPLHMPLFETWKKETIRCVVSGLAGMEENCTEIKCIKNNKIAEKNTVCLQYTENYKKNF